jgi:hypothetical protein
MKKILQLGLVCASIGIITASTSCSSTDYNAFPYPGQDTTKNSFRGNFTATIDGVAFVADNKYVTDATSNNIRTISISGEMDNFNKDPTSDQTISLSITNYKGPGVYPIQSGTAGGYIDLVKNTPTVYVAKTGDTLAMINITNDQGSFDGTFSFTVAPNGLGSSDNHNVSGGSFSVPK